MTHIVLDNLNAMTHIVLDNLSDPLYQRHVVRPQSARSVASSYTRIVTAFLSVPGTLHSARIHRQPSTLQLRELDLSPTAVGHRSGNANHTFEQLWVHTRAMLYRNRKC